MSERTCPLCGPLYGKHLEAAGPARALAVARHLVELLEDAQSGRLDQAAAPPGGRASIRSVQEWIRADPRGDLTVAGLARRAGMSQRNFARLFAQEAGASPARFVEQTRFEAACSLLHRTGLPLQQVAFESGFSGAQALRRAFHRRLGITPREYRARGPGPRD